MNIKRRIAGTSALMLTLGALVALGSQQQVAAADPLAECVSQYAHPTDHGLHKGQVKKTVGHATVVGGEGLTVNAQANGTDRSISISGGDDSNTAKMAKAYSAAGRSVLDDARAAGVGKGLIRKLCKQALADGTFKLAATASGSYTIVNSICVSDSVSYVEWDGCTVRYRATADGDPNWNYGIDDSQAYGHETVGFPTWEDLLVGGIRNLYDTGNVDIVSAKPSSDITDVSECRSASFGASAGGFGISEGTTICPSRWNITRTSVTAVPEYHKVQWEGESHNDREAMALSAYRYRPGLSTAYTLTINYKVG